MTDRERLDAEIERLKGVVSSLRLNLPQDLLEVVGALRRNECNLAYLEGRRVGYDIGVGQR